MIELTIACIQGLEDECAREAQDYGMRILTHDTYSGIITTTATNTQLRSYLTYALTPRHIMLHLAKINETIHDENQILHDYLKKTKPSFRATRIIGEREHEGTIGAKIQDHYQLPVNLTNPTIRIGFAYERIGILLADFELAKRDYKVYMVRRSLNPGLAASILQFAELNRDEILLDPFAGDGIIPIEYAHYANAISPRTHQTDQLHTSLLDELYGPTQPQPPQKGRGIAYCVDASNNHLSRARQNARLANAPITIARVDLEWLDTRFKTNEITTILTHLPPLIERRERAYEKILETFFARAHTLLQENAKICTISNETERLTNKAKHAGFVEHKTKTISRGASLLDLTVFVRG